MRDIRHRLFGVAALALWLAPARTAHGQIQNNSQTIHVAINRGTIIVTNGDKTATYPAPATQVDEATVRKIAEVIIAASAENWTARLGAALEGFAAQSAEIRGLLQQAARRDASIAGQIRDVRSQLETIQRSEERSAIFVRADIDERLERQAAAWSDLIEQLADSARSTRVEIDRLARALDDETGRLEESVARATEASLTAFFRPDPALRTTIAFLASSFAFPAIDAELAGSYAWRLSGRAQLGPVLGLAYCCLGPATQAGGFAAPAGTLLETVRYRAERLTFEVGQEVRVHLPRTSGIRLLGQVLYREHFVRWAPQSPSAPSASYATPAIVCRAGFDMRAFGPLVVGLSIGAGYDAWTKEPMWRYTGYLGSTVEPARVGGGFEVEAGMHLGIAVLD